MNAILTKKTTAYLVAACLAAQPAFAAVTDISSVPLGSAAGASYMPNLLFILDDSGSMASDYNPDYVNDGNTCMRTSGGSTQCQRGDPPYEAGGVNGFNGVGYDPNFTYLPGLASTGQPVVNPPSGTLTPTSVTPDAYLGGTNVDLTNSIRDKSFCNANNVCKRNGANAAGTVLPAGLIDAEGHTLAAGQFPYRTNASGLSTLVTFGLPEMMPIGTFSRSGTTVTATTVTAHGLTTADRIFVTSGTAGLNVTCVPVASVPSATTFTYTTSTTGTITSRTGSYRKCGAANFARSGNTVTVTLSNIGLLVVTGDIVTTFIAAGSPMNVTNATITVTSLNTLTYTTGTSGTIASTAGYAVRTGLYDQASTVSGPPVAYRITPVEYCTDVNLTNCTEYIPPATAPTGTFPAYVRFCKTQADALAPGAVTGTSGSPATNRCQLKYVNITGLQAYIYPRYGWFTRDTITSGVASYGNRTGRSDCASPPTCTYTEEIQNYAKWYAYYRTRMQMMKTSAGRSFLPFISNPSATPPKPDRLRVGFITINPTTPNGSSSSSSNVHSSKYLRIDTFNATNAASWYNKFYPIIPDSSTPLRLALSRAGWIFAGNLGTGLTSGILPADDPIQASCQKNYAFLTTDGFWNQGTGQDLAGNAIGNLDNVDNQLVPPYVSPNFMVSRNPTGTFDGNLLPTTVAGTSRGGSGTLADVAMYYYKTDLRPAGSTSPNSTPPDQDVSTNNVQAKSGSLDFATHQHMNTYTIGLADGLMRYQADYDDPTKPSDFNSIKNGLPAAGNCFWTTGTCNWPTPQADGQSALDDLWHAAANGRGRFYSAINPNALSTGLSGALNNLNVAVASAAAAATSSPQVSQAGSKAFSTTYQTSTWAGEVYAQNIDPQSGVVLTAGLPNDGKVWEAQKKLVARVANNIPRDLRTFDPGDKAASPSVPPVASKLKDFKWTAAANGALSSTEKTSYFMNKCLPLTTMAQCNTLTPVQLAVANNGTALVDFLSGKPTFEGTAFRDRTEIDATGVVVQTILGDIVNSQPVFVRPPFFRYDPADPSGRGGERIPELPGESYNTFKANNATRNGPLLIGANDGFLHAFNPDSTPNGGEELWAYVPRFLLPALYQLADSGYPGQHRFYVDGTPEVGDVLDETERVWKTIVVGGVNSGGRGFYALDITSPTNPKGLWEFCSSPTLCPDDYFGNFPHSDPDLGLSYGNPVIGRRASDGKWVVVLTSGLNNTGTSGNGKGYFYVLDAITGKILHKIEADDGTAGTTSPSGLMKIGAYYPTGLNDPQFTHVYGGDQFGRVWRVNFSLDPKTSPMPDYPAITTGAPFVKLMATLKDADGRIQPLTARPAGTHLGADPYNPTTRIYYVGTGRYVGNSDLADPGPSSGLAWRQSIYGIRDQVDNPRAGYNPASSFRAAGANFAVEQTLGLSGGGPGRTITKNNVDWSKQDGFFIDLNPRFPGDPPEGNSPGERIVLDVRLILGTLIFTSTIPRSGCEPGGESFQYFLDFRTGGYVGNDSTVVAGVYIGSFLVGTAIEQTSDDLVKALNKTVAGDNRTAGIPVDPKFKGERFSYRER